METKKTDRRIIKTKRAIRSAFAELLTRKELTEITVKEIADLADINRKTFYNYYSGTYQVMDEIENEIISAFEADLASFDIYHPQAMFGKLFRMIDADIEFYGKMIRCGGNSHLVEKLVSALQDKACARFAARYRGDPDRLWIMVNYTVAGIANVYQSWFHSDRTVPIEKLSKIVNRMVADSIKEVLSDIPVE